MNQHLIVIRKTTANIFTAMLLPNAVKLYSQTIEDGSGDRLISQSEFVEEYNIIGLSDAVSPCPPVYIANYQA